MLPKDQADRVGEAIIEEARLAASSRWRRRPVQIPLLCRCQELGALPRALQTKLVRQASRETVRSWRFVLVVLTWAAVWIYAFWTLTMSGHHMAGLVFPLVLINWAVLHLLRGLFLRPRVRVMAARLHGQAPSANSSSN